MPSPPLGSVLLWMTVTAAEFSPPPFTRPQVSEHLFSQAFVTALEHSYLFEECCRQLHSGPSCSGSIDPSVAESIRHDFNAMRRMTPTNVTELEIERMLGADGGAAQYFPSVARFSINSPPPPQFGAPPPTASLISLPSPPPAREAMDTVRAASHRPPPAHPPPSARCTP